MKKLHQRGKLSNLLQHLKVVPVLVVAVLLVVGAAFPGLLKKVNADAACTSIAACQQQIANDNSAVASLQGVAATYQTAIQQLQSQISSIEAIIAINQAKQVQLQVQIDTDQAQLDQQKKVLGEDLKAMYVSGKMTSVEMLATSKNLSDFVDAETYDTAVQGKIQETLTQITQLQNQLKAQQVQVEQLLAAQQSQQTQLANAEAQQQQLLAYNQSQQDAYGAQAAQSQKTLSDLIAAQLAANNSTNGGYYFIRFPGAVQQDPINGSYPYANAGFGMSTAPGCVDDDGPDQWGYCTRQCVSYAAWAVAYSHGAGEAPIGWGNAKDWVSHARAEGIPVYGAPQPGDIAIDTAGTWGHAMYVEKVSGSQIYVSQYNQQLTGHFSTQWRTWE